MPGHRGHDSITLFCAGGAGALAYYFGAGPWSIVALVSSTILGGCLFSPDLDLEGMALARWGPLGCLWRPYTWLFPHRHFLTHGWIALFSTALRCVYFIGAFLVFPALVFWTAIRFNKGVDFDPAAFTHLILDTLGSIYALAPRAIWITIFLGLWLGALAHTTADYLVSGLKRAFSKPRRSSTKRRVLRRAD